RSLARRRRAHLGRGFGRGIVAPLHSRSDTTPVLPTTAGTEKSQRAWNWVQSRPSPASRKGRLDVPVQQDDEQHLPEAGCCRLQHAGGEWWSNFRVISETINRNEERRDDCE